MDGCGAGSGAGAGPSSDIQSTAFSTGIQTFPVRVGVFFEQHDRRDLTVVLTTVDPVAYQIDQDDNGLDLAACCRLESHLDASVSAIKAFQVDSPFFLPRKPCVGHVRDDRFRLAD